jgi:hypothetical protein
MRRFRARKWLVAIALILAVAFGLSRIYQVSSKGLKPKGNYTAQGTGELLVDTRVSTLAELNVDSSAQTLNQRAPLYAQYATDPAVVALIARRAGLPADEVSVTAKTTQVKALPSTNGAPATPSGVYQVTVEAQPGTPVVSVTSNAVSEQTARTLARASVTGLVQAVSQLEARQHVTGPGQVILRPLGSVSVAQIHNQPKKSKAIGYGFGLFIVLLLLILIVDNLVEGARRRRRERAAGESGEPLGDRAPGASGEPLTAGDSF